MNGLEFLTQSQLKDEVPGPVRKTTAERPVVHDSLVNLDRPNDKVQTDAEGHEPDVNYLGDEDFVGR